jgi:predicted nucleic acid-binding protein
MTAQSFADTNVYLYAASKAPVDAGKKKLAQQLLASQDIGLSAQVLQEFVAAAAAKKRLGISHDEAFAMVTGLLEFPIVPITPDLVLEALRIAAGYQISYWDGAIIAAAIRLKCDTIYSEDLNDGQNYGGVVVVNPFKT